MPEEETFAAAPEESADSHWPLVRILAGVLASALLGGVGLPLLDATRGPWDVATLLVTGLLGWGFALLVTLCVR
ncbi:hypothetical protein QE393_004122 [Pseudomonas sp. SORGH_AS 211]|uniref:hypothetical protein n=1 Tax=Pseudomonas sp. SORGH_AS_0211 TaxID=3041796 RepID=UPI002857B896|nr:hypothetical protein [Pseudomonas sp. SORGH_AS_0211]MDR6180862.1 hypothetical protein [Pseudomonas sp. SORGH_AS_0211]